jgi:predicted alpha-1,2-mannosidase
MRTFNPVKHIKLEGIFTYLSMIFVITLIGNQIDFSAGHKSERSNFNSDIGILKNTSSSYSTDFTKFVDPFIGTGAHGHTFPGACLPFGMVQLSPDNAKTGWDWCSGYNSSDSIIIGFSHTHLSGTGCGDLQDVLLMPTTKKLISDTSRNGRNFIYNYQSAFSHRSESASPGFYSVKLADSNIKAELTATLHAGFHKYTFPKNGEPKIIIDLDCKAGWDWQIGTYVKVVDDKTVAGYEFTGGWAPDKKLYFAARFSKPFYKFYTSPNGNLIEGVKECRGVSDKAVLCFANSVDNEVMVKVGISSSGIDGAIKNLDKEIPGWNFEGIKKSASLVWNKELSKFNIETTDNSAKKTFYTAVYHSYIAPNLYSDVDGKYTGMDGKIHQDTASSNYFTLSLWDTFRAANPLYTITQPKLTSDLVNAILLQYKESGTLPVWSLWGNETWCMIGYHSVSVITDAYLKGIKGFDPDLAYKAMKSSAMQNRRYSDLYREFGYIPYDSVNMRIKTIKLNDYNQSASTTLEYAYDDWCIAQMAKALRKKSDYNLFMKRSGYFKNLADSSTGFIRPRNADESWLVPFNPSLAEAGSGFTEGNSWQYSWFIPHDVPFLIRLMRGKNKFIARLDSLFSNNNVSKSGFEDVSGTIGQYAQGNEPSHHVAYLYNFAGYPWKTQEKVSLIRDSLYNSTRAGLCGNDDCGQMSAWYIFSAIGFYPVNPATGIYIIGSPAFKKATINVGKNKTFTVIANNVSKKNIYIQSAKLNGKPLNVSFIWHKDIMNGGILEFEMGDKPNKSLWAADDAVPPSGMPGAE